MIYKNACYRQIKKGMKAEYSLCIERFAYYDEYMHNTHGLISIIKISHCLAQMQTLYAIATTSASRN